MTGPLRRFLRGPMLLPDGIAPDAALEIAGDRIVRVLAGAGAPAGECTRVADLAGVAPEACVLAPGFVDLHVHGGHGADFMDAGDFSPAGDVAAGATFDAVLAAHSRHGTTSLLATTLTAPEEQLLDVLAALARYRARRITGRAILGYHVEGPMLCAGAAGAQDARFLRTPSLRELDAWWRAGETPEHPARWIVTLAPELPGAGEVIDALLARDAIVSLGHTRASHDVAARAIARGARRGTHLWNAMGPLHHRDPGAAGALLAADDVRVEVVADGVHLHPATLRLVHRLRAPGEVLLVTDATRLTGTDATRGRLLDAEVEVRDGAPRLPDGTIAGSVLGMDRAVSVWSAATGAPLADALRAASEHPAASIGLGARKGRLAPGADADLVVLEVRGTDVVAAATIVAGDVVWRR